MKHKVLSIILLLSVVSIIAAGCAKAPVAQPGPEAITTQDAESVAYSATVYGFPMVVMDLTRQVFTAVAAPGSNGSPVNQFGNKKVFPDASFTNVVRPNADTLYSSAWLDAAAEPIILSVPDMQGRYYLMPILNYWTDVIGSPGSRTTATGGNFAITGPNWKGKLPKDVTEIKSNTRFAWIVGRIACTGPSDYENVWKLQDQLKLTPLSAWGTDYVPPTNVPVDASVNTAAAPLSQLLAMDAPTFFDRLCRLMVENPPYEADAPLLYGASFIGIKPGADYKSFFAGLSPDMQSAIQSGYQLALTKIPASPQADVKNGWQLSYGTGDYGINYMFRAAIAYLGLGANLVEDAFYPASYTDANGAKYNSDQKYILHFAQDQIPPVNGFWSLSMYNDKIMFVDNPINRYSLGSLSDPPLVQNPDGSLDIYIQRDAPDEAKTPNWLPAPASGVFSLTLRLYWPKQPVLDRTWIPPAVQPAE